ncbi:unnamed protein product, partial [Urochloa humidicola]
LPYLNLTRLLLSLQEGDRARTGQATRRRPRRGGGRRGSGQGGRDLLGPCAGGGMASAAPAHGVPGLGSGGGTASAAPSRAAGTACSASARAGAWEDERVSCGGRPQQRRPCRRAGAPSASQQFLGVHGIPMNSEVEDGGDGGGKKKWEGERKDGKREKQVIFFFFA